MLDKAQFQAAAPRRAARRMQQRVDLAQTVAECLDRVLPRAAARNVDMPAPAMPNPSTDWAVMADAPALRQTLFTLLEWALQHCPRGGELRVRMLARDGTRGLHIHRSAGA